MLTWEQKDDFIQKLLSRQLTVDEFMAMDSISMEERREVIDLAFFALRRALRRRAQPRAMKLLRQHLDQAQLASLRRSRSFIVQGSAGGTYRLHPDQGVVELVERHGKRWFARASFCYHDPERELPDGDLTLVHLLQLLADEPGFLAAANRSERDQLLWNGEYLRRVRRRSREEAAA